MIPRKTDLIVSKPPHKMPSGHMTGLALSSSLSADIDQLIELRALIRASQAAEKELTQQIVSTFGAVGLRTFEGVLGRAELGERVNLIPDVGLFLESLGPRAYPALVVRMEPARVLMSEGDLQAISERVAVPVLRVEARTKLGSMGAK